MTPKDDYRKWLIEKIELGLKYNKVFAVLFSIFIIYPFEQVNFFTRRKTWWKPHRMTLREILNHVYDYQNIKQADAVIKALEEEKC